jgi:hypothetical protein
MYTISTIKIQNRRHIKKKKSTLVNIDGWSLLVNIRLKFGNLNRCILSSLPASRYPAVSLHSHRKLLSFSYSSLVSAFFIHQPVQQVCSHLSICWCFSSLEKIFNWQTYHLSNYMVHNFFDLHLRFFLCKKYIEKFYMFNFFLLCMDIFNLILISIK